MSRMPTSWTLLKKVARIANKTLVRRNTSRKKGLGLFKSTGQTQVFVLSLILKLERLARVKRHPMCERFRTVFGFQRRSFGFASRIAYLTHQVVPLASSAVSSRA